MMRWVIWYHLDNLKNVKNTHGGVFFTFLKLYKWYQIRKASHMHHAGANDDYNFLK